MKALNTALETARITRNSGAGALLQLLTALIAVQLLRSGHTAPTAIRTATDTVLQRQHILAIPKPPRRNTAKTKQRHSWITKIYRRWRPWNITRKPQPTYQ